MTEGTNALFDLIPETLVTTCRFRTAGLKGEMLACDIAFTEIYSIGISEVLTKICGFDPVAERKLITRAEELHAGTDAVLHTI